MTKLFTSRRITIAFAALIVIVAITSWTYANKAEWIGPENPIGGGTMRSYVRVAEDGSPAAVGVSLSAAALQQLPPKMNSFSRCHDVDGNGVHGHHECIGDYETVLEIPADVAKRAQIPFKWILVNWNPEGHIVPAPTPYTEPHFDFHFYTWDRERVDAIGSGTCGELVDCEAFKRATLPLRDEFMPPDHMNVGAVVPRMGNHLVDLQSPELQTPPQKFTRTFIYGAFDGELIFWEPMITLAFMQRNNAECFDIRQPKEFQEPGYYPTQYCVKFDAGLKEYSVSMERFVRRGDRE